MAARAHSMGRADLRIPDLGEIARPFPQIPNLRPWLENRIELLLTESDRLIGLLDMLDGDADREDGGDLEPEVDLEPSLGWAPGESETGAYALSIDVDVEDEHDGHERTLDTREWGITVSCGPVKLGRLG